VEIVDPEGLPLARVTWPAGEVTGLSSPAYGPFRRLYLTPEQTRKAYAGRTVVPVTDALTTAETAEIATLGPVLLLALVGHGTPSLSPVALLRASLLATEGLPDAAVVSVPLASHDDPEADHALGVAVVEAYAGGDPIHALSSGTSSTSTESAGYTEPIAAVIASDQPAPEDQGLVIFFTGLSGSGKSTLARALVDALVEDGTRRVTVLDGDLVRRVLSAGLGFSRADRDLNVRRIGWVAAEVSRHGGVAVCAPIAPYAATRAAVRREVSAVGDFVLIHVATPLEVCERRDHKGLYAKARAGLIPEFTGISDPYEAPTDADLVLDTSREPLDAALDRLLDLLRREGRLPDR
jgi:sulfate adenylyltransferase